jgi:multimeric flavodoxin WrbA/putative sterol carrier protein
MKVLALNSSPRTQGQSKTELMLSRLVKGMTEAGAQAEVVALRDKKINTCSGCFSCWTKTPGVCIHKDDMSKELFDKFRLADMVVYASPLYHYTVNAVMKAFIERTLPMSEPFLVLQNGRTQHPVRYRYPKAVVLSVAGFHEMEIFGPISTWAGYLFGKQLAAEIYRPGAESMTGQRSARVEDVLAATEQGGRELIELGKITEATMQRIIAPVVKDQAVFRTIGNLFWKTCIDEGVTPRTFYDQGLVPRPDTIESFLIVMSMAFNRTAASDTNAVIQFVFSGEVEGTCHFAITGGALDAREGPADRPTLTISTPFGVWMDIVTGKADGPACFMEQKYTVEGDLDLLMRFGSLFGK